MTVSAKDKQQGRLTRHRRLRKKVQGTAERPRLAVFRSNKHMVAQVIDDRSGVTIAAASTLETDLRGPATVGHDAFSKTESAKKVGELVASRAKEAGVSKVVFDRGGYIYHGRIAALADAARAAGLEF